MQRLLKWAGVALAALLILGVGIAIGGGGNDRAPARPAPEQNAAQPAPPATEAEDTDADGMPDATDPTRTALRTASLRTRPPAGRSSRSPSRSSGWSRSTRPAATTA